MRRSLVEGKRGSQCGMLRLLTAVASLVASTGSQGTQAQVAINFMKLRSTGSVAVGHRLIRPAACRLSWIPGIGPVSPPLAGKLLTPGTAGKVLLCFLDLCELGVFIWIICVVRIREKLLYVV